MVHEISYVDARAQTLTMCARNITWADLLSVRETVTYSPIPSPSPSIDGKNTEDGVRGGGVSGKNTEDGVRERGAQQYTRFEQRAEITALCGGWSKIKSKIESLSCERFRQNALLGKEGFEIVLQRARQVWEEERARLAFETAAASIGVASERALVKAWAWFHGMCFGMFM
jgi:PRELI-like family